LTQKTGANPEERTCARLYNKYVRPYKNLWDSRGKDLRDEHTGGLSLIYDMTAEHCSEEVSRKNLLGMLSKMVNSHSGKILVLLPLSAKPQTKHIVRGLEAWLKNQKSEDATSRLIVADTKSSTITQAIAQSVFTDRPSAIIGGFETQDIEKLTQLASELMIPTFILNEPPVNFKPKPFVYFSHPTNIGIAKALVAANNRYRHKKISIMRPNDQHSDRLHSEYEAMAKTSGIEVIHSVVYDPKRIDQMESAARKLFKLESGDRTDELKELYQKAKSFAQESGTPFNPKMVALQPVITQDAILILDHFKNVRHMAKVFTFLGVRRIPKFGHFEWRSIGLIEPFDPTFTGSYFVDVTGSYSELPDSLKVPTLSSPHFISPDRVDEVDLTQLGYRTIQVPFELSNATKVPRRKLEALIPKDQSTGTGLPTFNAENTISWPSYLFEVTSQGSTGSIVLRPN
jgi:hypothetical protein